MGLKFFENACVHNLFEKVRGKYTLHTIACLAVFTHAFCSMHVVWRIFPFWAQKNYLQKIWP